MSQRDERFKYGKHFAFKPSEIRLLTLHSLNLVLESHSKQRIFLEKYLIKQNADFLI